MTYSSRFEKDILFGLNILVSKKNYKKILKQSDYDFTKCFIKGLISLLTSSNEFTRFMFHIYSKNLDERYFFNTLEEIEVAEIILKKYKFKTLLILKNKFIYYFQTYLSKIIIKTLIFFLNNQGNKPLKNLNNVFFYFLGPNASKDVLSDKIFPRKKKILTKFLLFKNLTYLFSNQKNFYIKNYFNNNYIFINRMFLIFFLIQKSIIIAKPKIVVTFEGDAWDHDMLYLLSKKIGFKCINIQTATDIESFQKAGFHNMEQTKLLVWGKHYKNIYRKICPDQKVIKVVGNALIFKKKKLHKNKIGIILQNNTELKLYSDNHDKFKELIDWLCITFNKEIIIRPHPLDNDDYYNLKKMDFNNGVTIHDPRKVSIGETYNECSIIFSKYSSSIIEAASIGVIPIIFGASLRFEKKINDLRNFNPPLISSSVHQVKESIIILKKNHKKRKFLSKKIRNKFKNHINYFEKDAIERIKSEINV